MSCLQNPKLGRASADWVRRGEPGSSGRRSGWLEYLCICEDRRRDDLVWSERLSRIDKRCQNLACFPALTCSTYCQRRHSLQPPASLLLRLANRDKRQRLTPHRRGQRIVESEAHLETSNVWKMLCGERKTGSSCLLKQWSSDAMTECRCVLWLSANAQLPRQSPTVTCARAEPVYVLSLGHHTSD